MPIDSSLSVVVKQIKILQQICQKEHRSELLTLKHFQAKYHTFKNAISSFEHSACIRSETYFTFFLPKVPCKTLCLCTYVLQRFCYCCVTWYESRTVFFSLFSLEATFLWHNHQHTASVLVSLGFDSRPGLTKIL